ncbi:MAG TPA: acetyl-CoA carboxylase biotin carboxyl carrier protein [Mycobacteriales bacterium]
MALTPEDIRALVHAFESSDWDEMSLRVGTTELDLTRTGRPPQVASTAAGPATVPVATVSPAAAPPVTPPTAHVEPAPVATPAASAPAGPTDSARHPDGHRVTAPSLGLFWRSPQPGAPPFVEVGQQVEPGDTVCIIEVMKLMNHVSAGVSGTVVAIVPDNGAVVEFGDPLIIIEPAG